MWLNTVECGQSEIMQKKFREARAQDAVRSRAYTGKPARQLRTEWTDAWDDPDTPQPLGMPLQYMLCSEALERIRRAGREELMGTPIGQLVGAFKETRTVAETIATLLADYEKTVSSLPRLSAASPIKEFSS
jgi:NAD(P)H-dependent flavin oxidoreductase YrpB (nitropropane dioxygenase family)